MRCYGRRGVQQHNGGGDGAKIYFLKAFSMFYGSLFFYMKNTIIHWFEQWTNAMVGGNSVKNVYKGRPKDFF